MGQTSREVMQSIGAFGLDAAHGFLRQAPKCHLFITASSPSNPSPLVADRTELYTSTEAVEQALPAAQEALYQQLRACSPEPLSKDDEISIQKEVLDTLHVVYIDKGQQYRISPNIHQVLEHGHLNPSDRLPIEFRQK